MKNLFTNRSAVRLFYFSGTGNTQIISNRISAKFNEFGYPSASSKMEENESILIRENEIIGLGFPIAAFTTYPVVFDFISKLPDTHGTPVFGFCTMGGSSLWGVVDKVRKILLRKGYKPVGFEEFQMPPNIFYKIPEKIRKSRIEKGYRKADNFAERLIDGKTDWNRKLIGSGLIFLFASCLFKLADLKIHQKYLKIGVDADKCSKCGLCVKKCPRKNISLDDKILIGDRCQYCYRCIAVCPREATYGILQPKSFHYRAEGSNL